MLERVVLVIGLVLSKIVLVMYYSPQVKKR